MTCYTCAVRHVVTVWQVRYTLAGIQITCESCNRQFGYRTCFDKHKRKKLRSVVGRVVTLPHTKTLAYYKRYCKNFNQNKEVRHRCFMQPLWNVLPGRDRVHYVFYDFEMIQHTKYTDKWLYMNLILSAYNRYVPKARTSIISSNNACSVVKEIIHFRTILSETCQYISVSLDPGSRRSSFLSTTLKHLTYILLSIVLSCFNGSPKW